jgi:hypothetical protein
MALTVPQQWSGAAGHGLGTATGHPDLGVGTVPTPGNWLVATVAWRVIDGSAPSMSVGDPSRNLWHLLYSDTVTAHATHAGAQLQVQVWACPAARYEGWDQLRVHFAAHAISASDVGSVAVRVVEIAGMVNGFLAVDSVTLGTATAAGSLSIPVPAPAGGLNTFVMAAAAVDNDTLTVNVTGVGYTALGQVTAGAVDVKLAPAWQATTGATTASWSLATGTANWAGLAVAIRETGPVPAQPNPNWPAARLEIGFGSDMSTPLTAIRWTDQTSRLVEVKGTTTVRAPRGIPYEMGTAQSEPADLAIRNDDGAYTPRTAGSASASATGTTSTFKCLDANAVNINRSDFFRLRTSAGALKELAVFQVTSVASVAGTTTVTFKRADATGVALVATATGDVYEGIPVDLYIPYRYSMMWGGKWYPVTSGGLGELPQTWRNPAWGQVPAVGSDVLSTLTAANPTILAGEIMRRRPSAYWPLNDPSGSTSAQDASGSGAPALMQTRSKFGAGAAGAADFGVSTQRTDSGSPPITTTLLGDPGSAWGQSGLVAAELAKKGFALVGRGDDFPPISGGVTILGVMQLKSGADSNAVLNATVDPTMVALRNTDPGAGAEGSVLKLAISHAPATFLRPVLTVWDKTTHVATTSTVASQFVGSEWRAWAVTFDQTAWSVYSQSFYGPIDFGTCNLASSFSVINVGGEADQYAHARFWPGAHAHIAVFPRRLTSQEFENLGFGAMAAGRLMEETTSQRVIRKLGTAGWKGPRIISASDVNAAAEGDGEGTISDLAATTAEGDDGLMFADAAGQAQWRGHVTGYYQSVRATLGEDTAAGEIPYQPSARYGYDGTYLYGTVTVDNERVTNFATRTDTAHVADDPASRARYGPRTLSRSTRLKDPEDAWGLSRALLARYSSPRLRVGSVEIDAASYPAAWPFVLGVEIGDLVTVKRRPMGAPVISQTCRVLRITPDTGPGRARWTLELAAADTPVVVLGDPVKGSLGSNTIGW